jgi:YegS/Rv2252/BmrU family lipid kinase
MGREAACWQALTMPNRVQYAGLVKPRVRLIVNPAAGGGRARHRARAAEQALAAQGVEVTSATAQGREHVGELAAQAARDGQTVVTVGGDGIVGAAANALREVPGALLGIVPAGRGNDLARALDIPGDVAGACALIAQGRTREIDLGEVDGRAFVGIASMGFDSVANGLANRAPAWLGQAAYVYGALGALARWRCAGFEIALEPSGERLALTGYTVALASSTHYGGGMRAAPMAVLDDGLLDLVTLGEVSRGRFLYSVLPRVFTGTHVRLPQVTTRRCTEAVVSADRAFAVYADGDPIGELPARIRVLRAALRVLVPRAAPR